ncbi:MAG: hypothetical protein H0V00_08030 [Chloroflexia bacterium]|nr:hypothetical protein [Chloroflexia bacterium]
MSDANTRSWDESVAALRSAASDVLAAVGRQGDPSGTEDAAATRLKSDVSRLEQSASQLLGKLASGIEQQRSDLETSFDRGRAEKNADQIKSSLEDLAALAMRLTSDIAASAGGSLKQADPELKAAVLALEDVARSATEWIRTALDTPRQGSSGPARDARAPLDDL